MVYQHILYLQYFFHLLGTYVMQYKGYGFFNYLGDFTFLPDKKVKNGEFEFELKDNSKYGLYPVRFSDGTEGYLDEYGLILFK